MADEIRAFMAEEGWTGEVLADSGNSYHLRYPVNLPANAESKELNRRLLQGLAARFDNDECIVDPTVFDNARLCKLYGTVSRKGENTPERPWRSSAILEVPTREVLLPNGTSVTALNMEPVPLSVIQRTIAHLPLLVSAGFAEMGAESRHYVDRLQAFLEQNGIPILNGQGVTKGLRHHFHIECPWHDEHGSITTESSTSVWYGQASAGERYGYFGFRCIHSSCGKRKWISVLDKFDLDREFKWRMDSLPLDLSDGAIGRYFLTEPEARNHLRLYDTNTGRATFVGSRIDIVDQSRVLLTMAVERTLLHLRWAMPPPANENDDYRRVCDSVTKRGNVVNWVAPNCDKIRAETLDANGYLIGLPGGKTCDLKTGAIRDMTLEDRLTRRLRITPKPGETPVYDYLLRSISSANDQPPDTDWIRYMEAFLGHCMIGELLYDHWPMWEGDGGNGKSVMVSLIGYCLQDFVATVRFTELAKDEKGGDNTNKRLNAKLIGCRVAICEEIGETGGHRAIETGIIKDLTSHLTRLIGAFLYANEIEGRVQFKLVTLFNSPPQVEDDAAFRRRVELLPFRASFNAKNDPDCIRMVMEKKNAPEALRKAPGSLDAMLRGEGPAILARWIKSAQLLIASGEPIPWPDAMKTATDAMFRRVNLYAQFIGECIEQADEDFTTAAVEEAAVWWFGNRQRDLDRSRLRAELEAGKFPAVDKTRKERARGFRGGRIRRSTTLIVG